MILNPTTQAYIREHINDDVQALALKKQPDGIDSKFALQQISAIQTISKKVPSWADNHDIVFPQHLSLEQCSSEATAKFKAKIIADYISKPGFVVADITGGLGIDCFFISKYAAESHYVEQNEDLCKLAQHNFAAMNTGIIVHNQTAEDFLNTENQLSQHRYDLIYIDPSRRSDSGQKVISISDCSPDILQLKDILYKNARHIVVKLSPMLDVTQTIHDVDNIEYIYIISVDNECKELLVFINPDFNGEAEIRAVNINSSQNNGNCHDIFSGKLSIEKQLSASISEPKNFIYEPFAAHIKSGLYKTLAQKYEATKIHTHSHLYTSDLWIPDFPGRQFKIDNIVPFDKKSVKLLFGHITQANITTRNFPVSVAEIRKKYKINDGGNTFIFATTVSSDKKVLIVCHKS